MGWNRYGARDSDGWRTVRDRGDRGRWGRGKSQEEHADDRLKRENDVLRKELNEAKRSITAATDRTRRPNARDSSGRHGDWMCVPCGFRSNRPARAFCYRCAAAKSDSFRDASAGGSSAAVAAAAAPPAACVSATPTSSSIIASTSVASTSTSAASSCPSAVPNPEAVKAIRARIQSLEAARAALASCPGCTSERDRIDQDISAARVSLSAYLPVEVAVKGTLGNAVQARAAVTKAEGKLAKLEAQIAALVELHEAAAAELETSRAKLAEAEAATAKAASIALPPEHYRTAISADPGPFWTAFKAVIAQRCPGMPENLVGQLDCATKAFEAAVSPIFVRAASSPAGSTGDDAGKPQTPPAPAAASANGAELSSPGGASGTNAVGDGPLSAGCNLVLAPRGVREPTEISMQEQLAAAGAAGTAAATEQEEAAKQAAAAAAAIAQQQAAQLQQQRQAQQQQQQSALQQQAAAAAAAAATLAANAVPVDGNRGDAGVDHELGGGGPTEGAANDPMGGGAADAVANKRNFDAISAAKTIAAKAKAKAAA